MTIRNYCRNEQENSKWGTLKWGSCILRLVGLWELRERGFEQKVRGREYKRERKDCGRTSKKSKMARFFFTCLNVLQFCFIYSLIYSIICYEVGKKRVEEKNIELLATRRKKGTFAIISQLVYTLDKHYLGKIILYTVHDANNCSAVKIAYPWEYFPCHLTIHVLCLAHYPKITWNFERDRLWSILIANIWKERTSIPTDTPAHTPS